MLQYTYKIIRIFTAHHLQKSANDVHFFTNPVRLIFFAFFCGTILHPKPIYRLGRPSKMNNVNIILANGRLGASPQTADGTCGMVLTGAGESGGYTLGTPLLVTGMDNLATQGITLSGNPFAYRQVKEFYQEAGSGALLYLMLVADTMPVNQMADNTNANGATKLLEYAAGAIKILGIMSNDTLVYPGGTGLLTTHHINQDVLTAATNMAVTAAAYAAAQKPFRCIIGGTSYTGTPASLSAVNTGTTNNRTAIFIGDTISGNVTCIGLVLGRLSIIPVQRKISRVRTGGMTSTVAYLNTSTLESTGADADTIVSKGYMTWKLYPQRSGYYISGDETLSDTTNDYHYLARGRVIDKVQILAYQTFVQEVDDEVPINRDGTLDAGFCKWLSTQMENVINNTMTANREVSSVTCYINPQQNILSTNTLNVTIGIIPIGYATTINITLQFLNPNNS